MLLLEVRHDAVNVFLPFPLLQLQKKSVTITASWTYNTRAASVAAQAQDQ